MTKSIKEYAMSLNKILSLTSLLCLLHLSPAFACPTIDLKNLQCETSDGYSYGIDYVKVEDNIFSFKAFGIPVEMQLPVIENGVVTAETYCDGNQIVTNETFKNISAVSVTKFENDKLTIKGQSIATKCDYPEGCRAGEHSFHQYIEEDIVCQYN